VDNARTKTRAHILAGSLAGTPAKPPSNAPVQAAGSQPLEQLVQVVRQFLQETAIGAVLRTGRVGQTKWSVKAEPIPKPFNLRKAIESRIRAGAKLTSFIFTFTHAMARRST